MTVEVIETVRAGRLNLATAVATGPWVFLNGRRAAPDRGAAERGPERPHPDWDSAPAQREAEVILAGIVDTLKRAGCEPRDVLRLDQYYRCWQAVPHYHVARRRAFSGAIPASTSILEPGLLLPGNRIEVEALARRRTGGEQYAFTTPAGLEVSPHMGFSPIAITPELVFFAGQMAEEGNAGIAKEAKVPASHLWKGSAIRLEAEYLIRHKLEPALAAAGLGSRNVVKAQAYLADLSDAPAFNEVWRDWFAGELPPTTIVPTARPGFNCPDASIEVNILAAADTAPRRIPQPDGPGLYHGLPAAASSSGLLFLSGLMALDRSGLPAEAGRNTAEPFFSCSAEAQAEHIIAQADRICAATGFRLEDAVRIVQFQTDLNDFYPAAQAWSRRLGDRPLPLTAVQVPGPLAVPGGSILADIWVGS